MFPDICSKSLECVLFMRVHVCWMSRGFKNTKLFGIVDTSFHSCGLVVPRWHKQDSVGRPCGPTRRGTRHRVRRGAPGLPTPAGPSFHSYRMGCDLAIPCLIGLPEGTWAK